ncbi:MAG: prolyl oligopeptidase family serine peptidase [Bacteroidales bacterium]
MKKVFFTGCLLSGFMMTGFAQNSTVISTYEYYGPVRVKKPVMVDQKDVNQKEFAIKSLLDKSHRLKNEMATPVLKQADASGIIQLTADAQNCTIEEYVFQITPDRYSTGNLKVQSPAILDVYLNGKLVKSKSTENKANDSTAVVTVPLTMEGRPNVISIRTMATPELQNASLHVTYTPDKKYSESTVEVVADGKRKLSIYDLMVGDRVSGTSISPMGKSVLVRVSSVLPDGKTQSEVQLLDAKTGKLLRAFDGPRSGITWMPVSEKLIFEKRAVSGRQLWTIDPATGEESLFADHIPEGGYTMSPTEDMLIYSLNETGAADKDKAFRRFITPNDRQPGWRTRTSLYKYDLKSGAFERLTFGAHSAGLNDISKDGKRLVFGTSREDFEARPFNVSSLFELNLETNTVDTLWFEKRYGGSASYSPDGKSLLISGSPETFGDLGRNVEEGQKANTYDGQLYLFDLATKNVKPVTREFNPAVQSAQWIDNNKIVVLGEDKDLVIPYIYTVSSNKYEAIPVQEEVLRSFRVSKTGKEAVYFGQSASNFNRAYVIDLKSKKSVKIKDTSDDRLADVALGTVEGWDFKASDGTTIDGRYYLPSDFDANKKYPMIVYYYGGTSPTSRTLEHPYPAHLYAAKGYVVLVLNPSGTTGYGQKMSARHVNAWGQRTAEDIIEGTEKFVQQHSFVNAKKIGCIGASYGGFMTQYLQTRTDLFAAAISHAGISALSSYWGEGYWGYSYSTAASADSYPWNNPDLYTKQSPLFAADKINTPLLLLHGSVDTNVPVGESIQMYTALKLLNKPVEMIQVDGENHGIANFDKKIKWTKSILAWFDRYLKDQPEWWNELYPESNLE